MIINQEMALSFKVLQIFLIVGRVSSASLPTTNSELTETIEQTGQSWKKSLSKAIQELTTLLEKMYEETTGKYIERYMFIKLLSQDKHAAAVCLIIT